MKNNLEKYTKAELISKLQNIKKENKVSNENHSSKLPTIIDVLYNFKIWVLSLTIITILLKIFKQYKSVRAILKLANFIVWSMFGLSIFEAFGFSFLIRFFNELRYIFGSIVNYLTDSTFYNYMKSALKTVDQNDSVRSGYKKTVEKIDWKAEFEKAERQREMEKWRDKYEKHQDDKIDTKTIALLVLLLSGTIATWYYGPDLLYLFSPIWNMKDLIKKILRGGRDDDDGDDNNIPIILENPSERSKTPDMLVYSSANSAPNALNSDHLNTISPTPAPSQIINPEQATDPVPTQAIDPDPSTQVIDPGPSQAIDPGPSTQAIDPSIPPAPPAPPIPKTESGEPASLLDMIKKGKKLVKPDPNYKGKTQNSKITPVLKRIKENFPNLSNET